MSVTRFAPSPTGRLHLGHAYSAVVGHDLATTSGGAFHLRIDDLDQTRCRPEFVDAIVGDLTWLGLTWGQPVLVQSERTSLYDAALESLRARRLVFPCFCTRADVAQRLTAPHGDTAITYSGTCRDLPDDPRQRKARAHSWRLNSGRAVELAGLPSWTESGGQRYSADASAIGDAILARKDAPASYHLSCVIDDAASGVDLVVRGADLRPSTPVQRLLQILLDLEEPIYFHHPLVTLDDGRRLAKRDGAPSLAAMRASGVDGPLLAAHLRMGQLPSGFRLSRA